jgi:hypothetical protein
MRLDGPNKGGNTWTISLEEVLQEPFDPSQWKPPLSITISDLLPPPMIISDLLKHFLISPYLIWPFFLNLCSDIPYLPIRLYEVKELCRVMDKVREGQRRVRDEFKGGQRRSEEVREGWRMLEIVRGDYKR